MNVHVPHPPEPPQVLEDRKWMLRDAARETLAISQWHGSMAHQYLEAGSDFLAIHHSVEMRRCLLVYLTTIKELAALNNEGSGAHG